MKLVSKKWQELKDNKEVAEMYEYLSLRDREAYAELKKYWDSVCNREEKPQKPNRSKRLASSQEFEELQPKYKRQKVSQTLTKLEK